MTYIHSRTTVNYGLRQRGTGVILRALSISRLLHPLRKALIGKGFPLVTPEGYRLWVDNDSCDYVASYLTGRHEPYTTQLIHRLIRKNDKIIDVGAHIGHFSLIATLCVGQEGHVWAFEPDPIAFSSLERNVELADVRNITCINAAISNQSGSIVLFRSSGGLMNSLYDSAVSTNQIEVECTSLDDKFDNLRVDGIKIDVEGAEPMVLQGAVNLIAQNPNLWMITEIRPIHLRQAVGINPAEYLQIIWHLGFDTFYIDEENQRLLRVIPDNCESIQVGNLLCLRPDSLWFTALSGEII